MLGHLLAYVHYAHAYTRLYRKEKYQTVLKYK